MHYHSSHGIIIFRTENCSGYVHAEMSIFIFNEPASLTHAYSWDKLVQTALSRGERKRKRKKRATESHVANVSQVPKKWVCPLIMERETLEEKKK